MKLRPERSIFQGGRAHNFDSHRHGKSHAWLPIFQNRHAVEDDEPPSIHICQYPAELSKVFEHAMKKCPFISVKETVMEGQPCIDGTRIPVRAVLRAVEHYGSIEGAISCYPHLNAQHVKDALYFSQVVLELPSGIDETAPAD
jgi:uncharacterized protein (DUF433 family)